VTRDVAGSAFQYAKIMTLPFFGSGIVELPPEGFKRAKNSRKMQMVFFVHQGKVLVTVGPPALENGGAGNDSETNEFAISKGGVWVVPRGMFSTVPFPFGISSQPPVRARWKPHRKPRGNIASTRLCKKSGQTGLPAHLLIFERYAVQKRCVRPAVGITSASHQNTARAA
jgi:centromere protein C